MNLFFSLSFYLHLFFSQCLVLSACTSADASAIASKNSFTSMSCETTQLMFMPTSVAIALYLSSLKPVLQSDHKVIQDMLLQDTIEGSRIIYVPHDSLPKQYIVEDPLIKSLESHIAILSEKKISL